MLESKNSRLFEHRRLLILSIFLFLLFCLLIMQFYKIQIIEGEKWKRTAQMQHQRIVIKPFKRGCFFSNTSMREGHPEIPVPFVIDVPKFHLYIDPSLFSEKLKIIVTEQLEKFVSSKDSLMKQLNKKSRCRRLEKWLSQEKKKEIEQWWYSFAKREKIPSNALFFRIDYQRSYPFGPLLGQVLHTIQEEKDPHTYQAIPTGGLELYFNEYLKGKVGKGLVLRSPRHPLDMGKIIDFPENGADIYLTINHHLQAVVEEELKKGVEKVHAKGGWAILMDPRSGEVWALAQYPFFDLSNFRQYFNDREKEEHTRLKAACDAFEPGSIFKPIILSLCFQANEHLLRTKGKVLFSPEDKIFTADGRVSGRKKPIKDGRLHRYMNMYLAIQKSSNIYVAKLIQRLIEEMGEEWFRRELCQLFGFGKKTEIEIMGETPGIVPTPGKLHPNKKPEWSRSTPFSLAIGHNILVNSIQMIRAFAILANGGFDIKPTLLRKIIKTSETGEQTLLFERRKTSSLRRLLPQYVCDEIIKGMKYVTKIGGTSPLADIRGYTEAGKSGTSEKIVAGKYSKKKYLSCFIGMAPAKHPRFVLLVVIDEPEVQFVPNLGKTWHGGVCAAPIFREIGTHVLQYLGIPPDDPFGYPSGGSRQNENKADWMKEVAQLRELYDRWNRGK